MIIDAFIFGLGEADLLEIRLRELSGIVDRFVAVESLEHHGSANAHPASCPRVFGDFPGKVEYVALPHLEPVFAGPSDSWPRENYHRNQLLPAIERVAQSPDDIVMISDADEIPRASAVELISRYRNGPHALSQDFFYYSVNTYLGNWNGTVVGTLEQLRSGGGPQAWRNSRDSWPRVPAGGWHFSYFGGLDRVLSKLRNFAHAQEDSSKLVLCRSEAEIAADMVAGLDIYQRPSVGRLEHRTSDDHRLPAWFLANRERFKIMTEEGLRESIQASVG